MTTPERGKQLQELSKYHRYQTVKDTTALTAAYVAATVTEIERAGAVGILIPWTQGDETSIEVKLEFTDEAGTVLWQEPTFSAPSSGVSTGLPKSYTFAKASWPTGVVPCIPISCGIPQKVKVWVKATGGTPTGTYKVLLQRGAL